MNDKTQIRFPDNDVRAFLRAKNEGKRSQITLLIDVGLRNFFY